MAGGKGKSTGGKAGPKEVAGKSQKSHSAKAGLQVSILRLDGWYGIKCAIDRNLLHRTRVMNGKRNSGSTTDKRVCNARKTIDISLGSKRCFDLSSGAILAHQPRPRSQPNFPGSKLTLPEPLVSLRTCQAFPEEQHAEQDARRRQGLVLSPVFHPVTTSLSNLPLLYHPSSRIFPEFS